jgi:hypothetical protein
MTKGDIIATYRTMSAEDQQTVGRWLKANMVFGAVVIAGLLFMAFGGPDLLAPNAAVAEAKAAATQIATPVPGRAMSPFDLMIRIAPDALPTLQIDEPF